jgi:hypothetical protein
MDSLFQKKRHDAEQLPQSASDRLAVIGALVLAAVLSFRKMADSDLWGHLACGEYFLRHKEILTTHYFNCSWPAFPYVNHSWLFQAIVAVIHRLAGEPGLMVLQAALVAVSFLLLFRMMRLESRRLPWIALVMAAGILASMHRFSLRPQHFTYVFLLYFLLSLRLYQRGVTRPAWFLPAVMVLWVNMHAESLWGIVVIGTYLLVEGLKIRFSRTHDWRSWNRLLLIAGGVLIASLINPFTYRTVFWPLFVMKEQFAGVEEILSPVGRGFVFFHLYFAFFLFSVLINVRRTDPTWLVMSIGFAAVAWTANRGIPHFVFVSAPVIAGNIEAIADRIERKHAFPRWLARAGSLAVVAAIAALILSIVTDPRYLSKYDGIPYPEQALSFLRKAGVRGNVFNEHAWGGFIIWNAFPDLKPYIDGRFFHKRFYDEYYPLLAGQPGWDSVLDRYGIDIAILRYSPSDRPRLNDRLFDHPRWHLVFWDDVSLVYLKEDDATRAAIARIGAMPVNPDRELFADIGMLGPAGISEANRAAERNLEASRGSFKALVLAANTWYALGDFSRARERYLESLRTIALPDPWVYYRIALCSRATGDLREAETYLHKTLARVPGSRVAADLLRDVRARLDASSPQPSGR